MPSNESEEPETAGFRRPGWRKPAPLGYGPAVETATGVAAPLLAGFSIAFLGVVGADADKFRWPSQAMLLSLCAGLSLIMAVQCGFNARQYLYSPADLADWWTEEDRTVPGRAERLQEEQRADFALWQQWARRGRIAYNLGIVLFTAATALVIAPPPSAAGGDAAVRWLGTGIAFGVSAGEAAWAFLPRTVWRRLRGVLRRAVRGGVRVWRRVRLRLRAGKGGTEDR
ncbi:hypothetical protein [Actinoplanes sp. HUAS TT8]|uniref:hypothetical protein n=1 Tax=Actinoplanes sp. HUAS TT8 TaxID=3447453 RepID=UPI003F524847